MSPALPTVASERLVFVAGLHRSGTTALARTLARHPAVSGFHGTDAKEDEGQHLQDVYPPARAHGGAGRFAFAPDAHLVESSPLATEDNAARLLAAWTPHWDLARHLLLEKSPPNLLMTRFLQALFPASQFVVVVRHPVVVSLSTRRWAGPGARLSRLIGHWLRAHELSGPTRHTFAGSTSSPTSTWSAIPSRPSRACVRSSASTGTYPSTESIRRVATATGRSGRDSPRGGHPSPVAVRACCTVGSPNGSRPSATRLDDLDHVSASARRRRGAGTVVTGPGHRSAARALRRWDAPQRIDAHRPDAPSAADHVGVGELFYLWRNGSPTTVCVAAAEPFPAARSGARWVTVAFGGWSELDVDQVPGPAAPGRPPVHGSRSSSPAPVADVRGRLQRVHGAAAPLVPSRRRGVRRSSSSTRRSGRRWRTCCGRCPTSSCGWPGRPRPAGGRVLLRQARQLPEGPRCGARCPGAAPARWPAVGVGQRLIGALKSLGVPLVRIRYEDLVADPVRELESRARCPRPDPGRVRVRLRDPGRRDVAGAHVVAGGRIRLRTVVHAAAPRRGVARRAAGAVAPTGDSGHAAAAPPVRISVRP